MGQVPPCGRIHIHRLESVVRAQTKKEPPQGAQLSLLYCDGSTPRHLASYPTGCQHEWGTTQCHARRHIYELKCIPFCRVVTACQCRLAIHNVYMFWQAAERLFVLAFARNCSGLGETHCVTTNTSLVCVHPPTPRPSRGAFLWLYVWQPHHPATAADVTLCSYRGACLLLLPVAHLLSKIKIGLLFYFMLI